MGDIVSQVKAFVDGPFGSIQLRRVENISVDSEQDAEIVTAVGEDGGAGYRFKAGGGEVSLDVYEEQGTPEVDWQLQKDNKAIFTFTLQYLGGQRRAFLNCLVANVSRKSDSQGSHMQTVKLKFLKQRKLPTV